MQLARVLEIKDQTKFEAELEELGTDKEGLGIMAPKSQYYTIKLKDVPLRAALILKQEMLAKDGEAALPRAAGSLKVEETDMILMGTKTTYKKVAKVLKLQPFGLKEIGNLIKKTLANYEDKLKSISGPGYQFDFGKKTYVMGILNVTPDSFSDGGQFDQLDIAVKHAKEMVANGADIIDIGGESTRPGSDPLPLEDELERVIPAIERLTDEIDVPISIDTYKSKVGRAALEAGAHIINDVTGFKAEPELAKVAAEYGAPVIVMHTQGMPKEMQKNPSYDDLISEILEYLQESINTALEAGLEKNKIIIDPGIGFGKTTDHNLEIMQRLGEFKSLGQPILLGTSRKSMIGNTLNLPVEERVEGTGATVSIGIANGADIVRVHDVKEMARVAKMTDAMVRR
ncbi:MULTISPECIES: dihydropteroate synthase [unclassified Candidatus Frackibacter]|uniref:dihydropteroate synthase n=1 Tax=unclassified Candidatus Frackibacter TaxID=2648818 RepID=UPI0007987F65|nr:MULTISPECIES: dihydropteroate synthase [unclassified Candidatus Frackibacter]KXS45985.1 MAG: dihydropteroate synthase [Candidatus Frackibacter sp. T328-2]SDC03964.1 Dihydropteroate synthase [Candidatus Frackibacter sp. WG11]SEM68481.1 Dihydropteroate synthase [Candidatus Frackibacter sp. WG12]SFL79765.1 Dihydropteroate synthase [Candidatus Frackibacter sp. WG13]